MIRSESGQGLVEAVAALPLVLVSSLVLVNCGVVVRDRVATTQAATHAAEALLVGADPQDAARDAMPSSLRRGLEIDVDHARGRVRVSTATRFERLRVPAVSHRSSASIEEGRR